LCQHALLMLLHGMSRREIAASFGKSERTIRRWIKKAKKKGLINVDRLKPWEQLSYILSMINQHRGELLDLKGRAIENGDGPLTLRCLRELTVMEEKRLSILKKVGLFDGYSPRRTLDWLAEMSDDSCRTEVEEEEEDEDYDGDEKEDDEEQYDEEMHEGDDEEGQDAG
jgi:transposase